MAEMTAVTNGGFPEPLGGHTIRLVDSRHEACGHSTRVRLPSELSARVVRRVICEQCNRVYEATRVEDCGIEQELAELTAAVAPAPSPPAVAQPVAEPAPAPVEPEPAPEPAPEPIAREPEPTAEPAPPAPVSDNPYAAPVPGTLGAPDATPEPVAMPEPEPDDAPAPSAPEPEAPTASAPPPSTPPPFEPRVGFTSPAGSPGKAKRKTAIGPELKLPSLKRPTGSGFDFGGTSWRRLSVPIAGGAVIIGLLLLQGGGDESSGGDLPTTAPGAAKTAQGPNAGSATGGKRANNVNSKSAEVVSGSNYTLALPKGWERVNPTGGATFSAVSPDGSADATLWIKRDPKLDFASFEANSLKQLEQLGGSSRVISRQQGPSVAQTVVTLGTAAPKGAPDYQVVLRASGPFYFYLATTAQPGAARDAINGVELIQDSLLPKGSGK